MPAKVNTSPLKFISVSSKSPHVDYLQMTMGKILPKALSEICEKRPPDPIEELAKWLYQWADCELYYYEKAIFAKELQLMALQLEKENANRMSRLAILKKEMSALKYLLSSDKALASYLCRERASRVGLTSAGSAMDVDLHMWAREYAADDMSARSATLSSDGHIASSKRRGSSSEYDRRKHRKASTSLDEFELSLDSRSDRKRRKKYTDGDIDVGSIAGSRRSRKFSRSKKKGRKETSTEEIQFQLRDEDSYGPDAKLKFGFDVTPVRCRWYLAEPRVLVCAHPVLGEMRANIPLFTPVADTPAYWERQEYQYAVMYDHEIYTLPDPHFDDNIYGNKLLAWADEDEEIRSSFYLEQYGSDEEEYP